VLLDPEPLRKAGPANPVQVRCPESQREGGRRLAAVLRGTHLSPQGAQAILAFGGRTALAAADILGASPVSDALRDHARDVHTAAKRFAATACIEHSDRRAVWQASQLHAFTAAERTTGRRGDVALEVAHQARQPWPHWPNASPPRSAPVGGSWPTASSTTARCGSTPTWETTNPT